MNRKDEHAVLLLPGIYNETLTLLAEAHDYFANHGQSEQEELDERGRTMFASEMSRITMRLSCIMAWLMARKAAFEGKITQQEAQEHYRLDCRDVSLERHSQAEAQLPERIIILLNKSLELYQRVARLDEFKNE